MPKLEYFLVCRAVLQDMDTDEISLVNVLDDISPESFPSSIPKAIAVSLWHFRPGELVEDFQVSLVVKVPKQNDFSVPLNFAISRNRSTAFQSVLDIPVEGPGDIEFELLLNGKHQASHVITIHPAGAKPVSIGELLRKT